MGKVKALQASTGTSAGTLTAIDGTATAKSADYTVTDSDNIRTVLMTTSSTNRTVTLPTAADNTNRIITVKKVDSGTGTVTIDGEGAETIDGATTFVLYKQYESVDMQCDGTAWHVTNECFPSFTYTPTITSNRFTNKTDGVAVVTRRRNAYTVAGTCSTDTTGLAGGANITGTITLPVSRSSNFANARDYAGGVLHIAYLDDTVRPVCAIGPTSGASTTVTFTGRGSANQTGLTASYTFTYSV